MEGHLATALEFDKILELVAAHTRTGVGRSFVERLGEGFGEGETGNRPALLTRAVNELIDEDGAIPLAGVDDALPWLEEGAPSPSEPHDLLSLLVLARRVESVRRRLAASQEPLLERLGLALPDTTALIAEVAPRLGRDGAVRDDASPELTRLRREISRVRTEVIGELDAVRRAHSEAVTDAPPTMRRDRYCVPVRSSAKAQIPGLLLDTSARGATSFVEPFAVVELNNRLAAAAAGEREEIRRIIEEIARAFADARDDLAAAVEVLGELDSFQARALFGRVMEGRVVVPDRGRELMILGARHPLLDERLHGLRLEVFGEAERRDPQNRVVPLDFRLAENVRTLVISGPNAGGKTIVLKTLGIMVLMCARGIPLPVEEGTTVPRFAHVWCHIGDEQDVAADLSTFSGAMAATARLLGTADGDTLVLFDELGAGTDPLEGAALGCALLEELTRRSSLTVASTHLAAIALAANSADGMDNAAMEYDEDSERPTYRLTMGRPGRSRGLEIADRMGIDEPVLERARELLGGNHLEIDRWLRRLEALEQELEIEREAARQHQQKAERLSQDASRELERLQSERRKVPEELAQTREDLRRRAKKKLDNAINLLQEAMREQKAIGRRRLQKLRDEALRLDDPVASGRSASPQELVQGARVRVALGGEGELREVRGTRAQVTVGGKRLWVPVADLEVLGGQQSTQKSEVCVESAHDTPRELNLIGLDSERAREELERHLDQAFTGGVRSIRVVHGHGAGILRRMVADVCRKHPAVRSFRHPPQGFGGTGATEIELEQT